MAPIVAFVCLVDGNRLIDVPRQPVARQGRLVLLPACWVEPPVLSNTHGGVGISLICLVIACRSLRRHPQHEVWRLALLRYQVAVPRGGGLGVHSKGDQQVWGTRCLRSSQSL